MKKMSIERTFLDMHSHKISVLWDLASSKPIMTIPIHLLLTSHKKKYWTCKYGKPISANEVLNDPTRAPEHVQKTKEANLEYPIIVAESNLDILDGLHRLNKCLQLGKAHIKAQIIGIDDLRWMVMMGGVG